MDNNTSGVVRHPDFEEIKRRLIILNLEARKMQANCPDCAILKQKYDEVFSSYQSGVKELDERRRGILDDLKRILETKKYFEWTQSAWQRFEEQIEGWRVEQNRFDELKGPFDRSERARERSRSWKKLQAIIEDAKAIERDFDESEIEEAKRLDSEMRELEPILKTLSKSTHKWKPIEWINLSTYTSRIKGAEGSLDAPRHRKTGGMSSAKKWRCNRCQKEEERVYIE